MLSGFPGSFIQKPEASLFFAIYFLQKHLHLGPHSKRKERKNDQGLHPTLLKSKFLKSERNFPCPESLGSCGLSSAQEKGEKKIIENRIFPLSVNIWRCLSQRSWENYTGLLYHPSLSGQRATSWFGVALSPCWKTSEGRKKMIILLFTLNSCLLSQSTCYSLVFRVLK